MIKLDVTKLAQNLKQAEAEPDGDITQRDIHPYLLEHVVIPFLDGTSVKLDTLDYTAFSTENIIEANREIDEVSNHARRAGQISGYFQRAAPTVRKTKAFC